MPSRSAVSRAASASATSSGSSRGFVSAAMARRDSLSARAALAVARATASSFSSSRAEVPADEGELLCEAVVQVAGQAPALLEHGRVRERLPVRADLPCRGGEDGDVEREPEEVARVDVLRVERRVEEVVQAREGAEQGSDGEPLQQLVAGHVGPAGEANRREAVEAHPGELRREQAHVPLEPRSRRLVRRQDQLDPRRQPRSEGGDDDRDQREDHRKGERGGDRVRPGQPEPSPRSDGGCSEEQALRGAGRTTSPRCRTGRIRCRRSPECAAKKRLENASRPSE